MTLTRTAYPFRARWNDCQVRRAGYTGLASYPSGGYSGQILVTGK